MGLGTDKSKTEGVSRIPGSHYWLLGWVSEVQSARDIFSEASGPWAQPGTCVYNSNS